MNGDGSSYASETVWNWGYVASFEEYVGTSGGISSHYPMPSWQAEHQQHGRSRRLRQCAKYSGRGADSG